LPDSSEKPAARPAEPQPGSSRPRRDVKHIAAKIATLTLGAAFTSAAAARLRARLDRAPHAPGRRQVALVAHVFYPELAAEVVDCHSRLPPGSGLIVTTPAERLEAVQKAFAGTPGVQIVAAPNRGRDIAPFLRLLNQGLLEPFDAVLKLHTKRSPHLRDGDIRRRLLFTALAGSKRRVARLLLLFDDPSTGLVGWRPSWRRGAAYWMLNRPRLEELARRMGIAVPAVPAFFEGTMFWVRPASLEPLLRLALAESAFEPEDGQLDGTLHHAVERLFSAVAQASGFSTRDTQGRVLLPGDAPHSERAGDRVAAAVVLYRPDPPILDRQLQALTKSGCRLILFANGPLTAEVESRLARLPNAAILRSPENIGLGAGLNAVVAQAGREGFSHLFLLDQDSEPAAGLPQALLQRFRAEASKPGRPLALLAPRLVPPDGSYRALRYHWRDKGRSEALFAPTSGSLLSLDAFHAVGPFREDYFVGGIDVEWGLRADRLGYRTVIAQDLSMPHRWGTPSEQARNEPQILRHSPLRNYFYIRNAMDCILRSPAPMRWRARQALVLAGQIARLKAAGQGRSSHLKVVGPALRDGWRGRLGPAPAEISAPR
jgi:GT2 family glycosyltransferase